MNDPTIPNVQNKTTPPPGVVPKNAQAKVIGGVAILMVLVIAFSGRNGPKKTIAPLPIPAQVASDSQQARIQEYRARIDEQAQKLAAEQAKLTQTQHVLAVNPYATPAYAHQAYPAGAPYAQTVPMQERDPLDDERVKREYFSRFSSNVAFTTRSETKATEVKLPEPATGVIDKTQPAKAETISGAPKVAKANTSQPGEYLIYEGTVIETVLTNRLDGAFSGPLNCMVSTDLYSQDGQHLLIPKGSRALGEVKRVETFGQERLAVSFHRLLMPDGYSVDLDQFKGLNQVGETGLRDQVNRHYLQVFAASLAIGLVGGLSQANTRYGADTTGIDVYRQGVASSLSQSSIYVLDRFLNVLPTFTIREGHRVKIYLSEDLLLPAYEKHPVNDREKPQ